MNKVCLAFFDRFIITMSEEQARAVSHEGRCDADVEEVAIELSDQLDTIQPDAIRAELRECGAWSRDDLADDAYNRLRIVWVAGCNIREGLDD